MSAKLHRLVVHLRLHYQILLAPIFLWGFFLSGGPLDADFWLALVALHVFLYGGTTAFNSYFDRDEGPVGGLAQPPAVDPALLPFSLLVQFIGVGLAAWVNGPFLAVYLLIFGLGLAYSAPPFRFKARPLLGLATVGLGQGWLVVIAGWLVGQPSLAGVTEAGWLSFVAVTLITTGFYPITQIYQIDEDRARGDQTFAVWAGWRNTFIFAVTVKSIAAVLLVYAMAHLLDGPRAGLVGLFYAALIGTIGYWANTFREASLMTNFRRVMRMNLVTSLGFLGFIVVHLLW